MAVSNKESVISTHTLLSSAYLIMASFILLICFFSSAELADTVIASMVAIFLGVLGALHIFARKGIIEGREIGEKVSFWLACFLLLGFPIGTFIGIGLIACLKTADEKEA